jgi:hypothetical protein
VSDDTRVETLADQATVLTREQLIYQSNLAWDRAREEAEADVRASVKRLWREYGHFHLPGGNVIDHIRYEVDALASEVDPPTRPRRRTITASVRKRVFERDAYRCVECRGWVDLTIDHIVPVVRGGTDDEANLQTMCRSCNSRKGTS